MTVTRRVRPGGSLRDRLEQSTGTRENARMQGARVVVRHADHGVNRGIGYDLVLDGEPAGRLEASGERWLTVEPGPHSLFVNHAGFRQGVIKAFVATPGSDTCLWVAPIGLTSRLRFVEQVDEPPPPVVPWRYALVMPAPAVLALVLLGVSGWSPWPGGPYFVTMVSLVVMWVRAVAHATRARVVGVGTLLLVELGSGWVGHTTLAVTLRLVVAMSAASFAYAAATRDLPFDRRPANRG